MSFHTTPLGLLFVFTLAMIAVALEAGYRLGKWRQRRTEGKPDGAGAMVGPTIGLLAFMLAFTFNGAASRHDARKGLVVRDANAIETAWLRAGLLPEPERGAARALLREYTQVRVELVAGQRELGPALRRTAELQDRLWDLASEAALREPASHPRALFVESLNHLIDTHLERVTMGIRNRVPQTIWAALYLLTAIAMGMMGVQIAHGGARHLGIGLSLALAFSTVLFLIADLDRPQEGLVNVDQEAMIGVLQKLESH